MTSRVEGSTGNGLAAALLGTWKLTSFRQTTLSTGETSDRMGEDPDGYIVFSADGRMQVLIVQGGRHAPADAAGVTEAEELRLYRTMMAYGGTWATDDAGNGRFDIDIAWNAGWTGESQARRFRIDGDALTITVGPQIGVDGVMIQAELRWRKV